MVYEFLFAFLICRHQRIREGFPYPLTAHNIALFPVDVAKYEGDILPGGGALVRCYSTLNVSLIIGTEPDRTLIYPCPSGYCKKTDTSTWVSSNSNGPCSDNREGFLCGQCKEGFAVTPLSNVSCSLSMYLIPACLEVCLHDNKLTHDLWVLLGYYVYLKGDV